MTFSQDLRSKIQPTYQSQKLAQDFYEPVLSEASVYKRVSAYFSSEGLALYSKGLDKLFDNKGFAQFIISTDISEEDFSRIQEGYELKRSLEKLTRQLKQSVLNNQTKESLGNLAFMIANGHAEVKFAIVPVGKGIFHDKFGLISSDDDTIFFNGSVNETRNGLELNYESISVDVSWDTSINVQSRIKTNEKRFERLWINEEPNILTVDATEIVYSELKQYQEYSTVSRNKIQEVNSESVSFYLADRKKVVRQDNSLKNITNTDRKLKPGSDLSSKYFEDDNSTIKSEFSYMDINYIIEETRKRCKRKNILVEVSEEVKEYLESNQYSIDCYKKLGLYLKSPEQYTIHGEQEKFEEFVSIISSEVVRPFKKLQLEAAFYEYRMARAANFSVPGSGKTAMILAVFAFLNSSKVESEHVDNLLVICPINAFNSWKEEFKQVFGEKKRLKVVDCQNSKDFSFDLSVSWKTSNLILVNYESLTKYKDKLQELLSIKTMIVFDEVHRIKNPSGVRAQAALELVRNSRFKFVLTGTPIPNSYQDIYNFLHLLYANEYNAFFRWDLDELKNPSFRKISEINQALAPFFWRLNKNDLGVPKPDPDIFLVEEPSEEQKQLAQSIYYNESSSLARLIRLIQASTNPELLNKRIEYKDMWFADDNDKNDTIEISEDIFYSRLETPSISVIKEAKGYDEYDFSSMISPKFEKGIQKIQELISEGKKVIVWAIFVNTMKKIKNRLNQMGIPANLVYGSTDVSERQNLINDFRFGNTMVMISNPQTLGESVSLHREVHDALYFEYNFNLTFMLQSRDRIHRLGLEDNQYTRYYYLQTKSEPADSGNAGYVDEKIYEKLKKKEETMYNAIDNGDLKIEFSQNEIDEAISIIEAERKRITKNLN
ncbi:MULTISPECIES: SNF2-related protein [Streptococcus]|jgi:helicase|uniref:SNF2-related protein n=1 Tax=Streptococcus TaxID=1301 RepID=UPI000660A18E|nr:MULTISPECIES: SNF2-related protein [Streptococcus]MBF1689970.1 DEAD/DEAH box helicase family protein [Streptococcus cristatus]MBZ2056342.1 DEAD/DEAH box helicase family protein [Streptococcus sanguinis]MDN5012683.1 SNF2-related protein [Streptococcus sp. SN3]